MLMLASVVHTHARALHRHARSAAAPCALLVLDTRILGIREGEALLGSGPPHMLNSQMLGLQLRLITIQRLACDHQLWTGLVLGSRV